MSVWLADLDPVVGSEQGKKRPVLIVSSTRINGILPVVNIQEKVSAFCAGGATEISRWCNHRNTYRHTSAPFQGARKVVRRPFRTRHH